MTRWNPITSYGIANTPGNEPGTPLGTAYGAEHASDRRPLGFVDVRAEATTEPTGSTSSETPTCSDDVRADESPSPTYAHELPVELEDDAELSWPGATVEMTADAAFVATPVSEMTDDGHDLDLDVQEASGVAVPAREEKVPFLKREIRFGRKSRAKAAAAASDDSAEALPPVVADQETGVVVEARLQPEPVAVEEGIPSEAVADELAALLEDTPEADEADDAESGDGQAADEQPTLDPVSVVAVEAAKEERSLFRKRDLSSRRSKAARSASSTRGGGRSVGLEIGASQIAAAVIVDSAGRKELTQIARTPIEPGLVVDGEVRDGDGLSYALRSFFDEHKLPRRDVRLGLASNRIGVRTLDIVGVDDEARFANAVRFRAHEVLPMAMQESTLDYRVVGERLNEVGESIRRVLLAVAPRDQVTPYVDVAAAAGISLGAVDLEALGLLRAFVDPTPVGAAVDAATVIVNIGHESSILLVSGGGTCEFTRPFEWGGATLQSAIEQELDVHPVEAATILRHISLGASEGRSLETLDDGTRRRAVEAVRSRLAPFARELVSSLQYYQTQPDSLGIEEIIITGGTSALGGLAETLHQIIGVPVRVGDPLARVIVQKGLDVERFTSTVGSLSVAIGLAIDDLAMRSVNLLPQDARVSDRTKLASPRILVPAAALLVPAAAVALLFIGANGSVSDKQTQLATLQADFAALPQPAVATIDPSLQGEEASRAIGVANVLTERLSWDVVLGDLSRVIPRNVWLSSLDAQSPRPFGVTPTAPVATAPGAPLATPTGMTVQGYTYTQVDVARLMARLATLPSLTNVQLQKSAKTKVGTKNVVQFTVVADLRDNGGTR
jgi:type IV pilus assembly protein PilM